MQEILVALDLETTGFSGTDDAIIEIGAVKFRGEELIESYQTYVNPERNIPPRVTAITGIKPNMVANAPKLAEVLPRFREFVGDHNIVGHNIGFDVDFLRAKGLPLPGKMIDTYELASCLLPTAPRYNLNAIMQLLGLSVDGDYHSALTDSKAAMLAYNALWGRLITSRRATVANIVEAAKGLNWLGKLPFEAALNVIALENGVSVAAAPLIEATPPPEQPVTAALSAGAAEVQSTVYGAFRFNAHTLLETPAGVERGAGYLSGAIQYGHEAGEKVGIVTYNQYNTDTRDRLIETELPIAQVVTGISPQTAILKSRTFYLCPRRLETLRRRPPTSIEELRVLAKILMWGEDALIGDRDSISLRGPQEMLAWSRLSAEDEHCTLERCETQTGGACPFYKACRAAQKADVVFADQSLLFADTVSDSPILPELNYLIVDDSHHIEDAATVALSRRLDLDDFKGLLADLGSMRKGLIADLYTVIEPALSEKQRTNTLEYLKGLAESVRAMQHHSDKLYDALANLLNAEGASKNEYIVQTRITPAIRERSFFEPIRATWTVLHEFITVVSEAMGKLADRMVALQDRLVNPALPDVIASARAASRHLADVYAQLEAFIAKPDANVIYWLDSGQDQQIPIIRSAPLHIGQAAEAALWNRRATILTGTTLQAGSGFDYLRDQLNAPHAISEQIIENPANFKENVLLFLPSDIAEPNEKDAYQKGIEKAIIELANALDGHTMALFTGYGQMRQTAQSISARLALGNIQVLDQSDGTSRQALIDGFHTSEKAVLFGGKSMWEEADLSPDALAALIITRLPFMTPGEAVTSARGDAISESFNNYSVPDAILKFRQAFNRLTRPYAGRRGVVVVLDKRLVTKSYGQTFIESLPPCTIQRGTLAELGRAAKGWIDGND
jgi:ATP-dependent DNA helicase DinG